MAEENKETIAKSDGEQVEVSDRNLFDFMAKKVDDRSQEECMVTGVEKLHVDDKKEEEKGLRRSHSSSSSSSDEEEVGPDGEKRRKKKGLKEKFKGKLGGEEEAEGKKVTALQGVAVAETGDSTVVVEKVEAVKVEEAPAPVEEKKGFIEKIKEKLPGHKKDAAEGGGEVVKEVGPPHYEAAAEAHDVKEKKGFLGKIMDKLPGHHPKEEADKNAPPAAH